MSESAVLPAAADAQRMYTNGHIATPAYRATSTQDVQSIGDGGVTPVTAGDWVLNHFVKDGNYGVPHSCPHVDFVSIFTEVPWSPEYERFYGVPYYTGGGSAR